MLEQGTEEQPGERLRQARRQAGISAAQLGVKAAAVLGRAKPISESAVRNQENGTNGIPAAVAGAYGEVLGVDGAWILWGHVQQAHQPLMLDIVHNGSDKWTSNPLIQRTRDYERDHMYFSMRGFGEYDLDAHEIIDDTLSPFYPRGTVLVVARPEKVGVQQGDIVRLARNYIDVPELEERGSEICFKRVTSSPGLLTFSPAGLNGETYSLAPGESLDVALLTGVVVAIIFNRPGMGGSPVPLTL